MSASHNARAFRTAPGRGILGAAILLAVISVMAYGQDTAFVAAPQGASVKIAAPADGASVTSPFNVVFQVSGAQLKPAGAPEAGTGHHHLLVDEGPTPASVVVPADARHLHFGKGQTETTLNLGPGMHTLTLQFADGLHRSYGPSVSHSIKVRVLEY
jgi:hypothetical protein